THMDYKMWVLQGHYQSERNFTFEDLAAAKQRLLNYRNFAALRWQNNEINDFEEAKQKILAQLNNNLNSAGAFSELDAIINSGAPSEKFVKFIDEVFGLGVEESTPDISEELKDKISERFAAKKEKDFAKADALRDEILAEGITLLDGADKTIWQYK
ncbi:hypothetical protein J5500_04195, partial [Candidatus Saccharibacteria bacterium]|nr:hypothetical protein [Candidatus Saccharibacteria bacterium]